MYPLIQQKVVPISDNFTKHSFVAIRAENNNMDTSFPILFCRIGLLHNAFFFSLTDGAFRLEEDKKTQIKL